MVLQIDPWLIAVIVVLAVVFIVFVVFWSVQAHRRRVSAGREELIGRIAEVRTVMEPKGTVFVDGENWTAITEDGRAEPGDEVTITKVDGLKLRVAKNKN